MSVRNVSSLHSFSNYYGLRLFHCSAFKIIFHHIFAVNVECVTFDRQTVIWRNTSISCFRQCWLLLECTDGASRLFVQHILAWTIRLFGMFYLFVTEVCTWNYKKYITKVKQFSYRYMLYCLAQWQWGIWAGNKIPGSNKRASCEGRFFFWYSFSSLRYKTHFY